MIMKNFRQFITTLVKPFNENYFYVQLNDLDWQILSDFEKEIVERIDRVHIILCLSSVCLLFLWHPLSFLLFILVLWWFIHDISHLKEPLYRLLEQQKKQGGA